MTAKRALYIVLVFSAFKEEYFLAERALNRQKIFKRIVAAIVFALVTVAAAAFMLMFVFAAAVTVVMMMFVIIGGVSVRINGHITYDTITQRLQGRGKMFAVCLEILRLFFKFVKT